MRKKTNVVIAVITLTFFMSSCNSAHEDLVESSSRESVTELQTELSTLNNSYAYNNKNTRSIWKFLRSLAVCCADVAGYIYGRNVETACKASEMADMYLPKTSIVNPNDYTNKYGFIEVDTSSKVRIDTTTETSIFKDDALLGLSPNEVGYVHNKLILDRNQKGESTNPFDSISKNNAITVKDMSIPYNFKEVEGLIPSEKLHITNDFSEQTLEEIIEPIKNNNNITVSEYIYELDKKTNDIDKKNQLKIMRQILEGLQYVDDNDTTYIAKARDIIRKSKIPNKFMEQLLDASSIAYASAKLWVTEPTTRRKY